MRHNVLSVKRCIILKTGFIHVLALLTITAISFTASGCEGVAVQPPEDQPFVFLFMSDTQADPQTGDYSGFGSLLANALNDAEKPSLIILGGDTVNDDADEDEWRNFFRAAGSSLDEIPVAAAAGNHDSSKHLAGRFDWPISAPEKPYQGYFYSFDMGVVHFTVMDSNIMGAANDEDIEWLKEDLSGDAAAAAEWRVAICHHPFWPVAEIPKDINRSQTMREHFLPLFTEYGVDLLLVGHQNIYSRCEPEEGPVQVMAASGGKVSYTPVERPYLIITADAPNYVRVTASGGEFAVAAFDASGNTVDSFVIPEKE